MPVAETPVTTDSAHVEDEGETGAKQAVELEVLVEEISIDGMCGVY